MPGRIWANLRFNTSDDGSPIEVTPENGLPIAVVNRPQLGAPESNDASPFNATSAAYENSRVIKTTGGVLHGFSGFNSKGSAQWILVFDASALPSDGAIPVIVITAATIANFSYNPGIYGRQFKNGIVICNSSTGPTKTIASADCWFDCQYK